MTPTGLTSPSRVASRKLAQLGSTANMALVCHYPSFPGKLSSWRPFPGETSGGKPSVRAPEHRKLGCDFAGRSRPTDGRRLLGWKSRPDGGRVTGKDAKDTAKWRVVLPQDGGVV